MTLIGKILAGRYEILEEIGNGGMAVVYKAKCQLLNRFVAVKVLRPDLQNDEEFVRRFNVEAQAAASLAHPNIVSIYDVGCEDGLHYIVMEFIEGKTLKEYIDKKNMLPWREAVEYTIQIAKGLEQAHKNSIVHRDIKPHNIIMTADGVLKVTDFGIARANVQTTVKCEDSAIGSVHYISPEQARGGYTDERSDIYSLAVVLYEMLTGRVPFESDRPVAVAIMHLQEKPDSPRKYNISIPLVLEKIVLKAMSKEISARYRTVTEMISELQNVLTSVVGASDEGANYGFHVAESLDDGRRPGGEPVVAAVTDEGIATTVTEDLQTEATEIVDEIQSNAGEMNESTGAGESEVAFDEADPVEQGEFVESNMSELGETRVLDIEGETTVLDLKDEAFVEEEETEKDMAKSKKKETTAPGRVDKKKARKVVLLGVISACVLVFGLALFLGDKFGLFTICSSNLNGPEIPDVVGMLYDEAVELYDTAEKGGDDDSEYSIDLIVEEYVKSDKPRGTILEQNPGPGDKVNLYTSPIIVKLKVSEGNDKVQLDDYVKKDKNEVRAALRNLGLEPEFQEEFNDDIPSGLITQQNPQAGSIVEKGSKVLLYVSKGPDKNNKSVEVPDLTGKSLEEAERAAEKQGFRFAVEKRHHENADVDEIYDQTPKAGTKVEEGTKVTVFVSLGPEEKVEETEEKQEEKPEEKQEEKPEEKTEDKKEETEKPDDSDNGQDKPEEESQKQNQSTDDNKQQNNEEKTNKKNKQLLTVEGPENRDNARVMVKVDGDIAYNSILEKGEKAVLSIESSKDAVDVEIYYNGELSKQETLKMK